MIDWQSLLYSAVWIAGLAVLLATVSVTIYRAEREGVRLRAKLGEPSFLLPFDAGMLLLCTGLLLGSKAWWERVLWGVLTAVFAGHLAWTWREARAGPMAQAPLVAGAKPPGRTSRGKWADRSTSWLGPGLVLAGVVVIGVWMAVTTLQLLGHARSLQTHLQQLEQFSQREVSDLELADLESAGQHLSGMREDLEAIQSVAGPLLPAGKLLSWLPKYGSDLAGAADLLDIAVGVTSAGDRTFQALAPALDLLASPRNGSGSALGAVEQLAPVVTEAQPELRVAQAQLAAVVAARARIDPASLSPRVAGLLQRLDRYLPWFQTAVDAAILAPELLATEGASAGDGARTYLILAQNNQELRATGGFISGVGELKIEGGKLTSLDFTDSYAVDNLEVPHDITPPDFQKTLFGQLWFFRDANWDADFPTSAQRILDIYARDRGVQADGVIALDLSALQLLVDAVGPLHVAGVAEPVTGSTVLQVIQAQWGEPAGGRGNEWWVHRKDFMGQITAAAMTRLVSGGDVEPVKLASALKQGLDEKHILMYLTDPLAADLLSKRNWDGALPVPPSSAASPDLLAVVDSNVGFNKVDPNVQRTIEYRVDLSDEEGPRARLTLTYHNHSRRPVEACLQESRYGDTYADMMDRCYWDYVRVYVPAGSALLAGPDPSLPPGSLLARNDDAPVQGPVNPAFSQGSWTVWTAFFDLAPGTQRTLTFDYRLPATVLDRRPDGMLHYHLQVQKQPGTEAVPLGVELVLPPDAEVIDASPASLPVVATDLRTDRDFVVLYREGTP